MPFLSFSFTRMCLSFVSGAQHILCSAQNAHTTTSSANILLRVEYSGGVDGNSDDGNNNNGEKNRRKKWKMKHKRLWNCINRVLYSIYRLRDDWELSLRGFINWFTACCYWIQGLCLFHSVSSVHFMKLFTPNSDVLSIHIIIVPSNSADTRQWLSDAVCLWRPTNCI